MTENSKKIFDFLKENYGTSFTKEDLATALGVSIPTITGSVNGLVKKGYAVRTEEVIPSGQEGGKDTVLKHIELTEAGLSYDPEAEEAARLAAKEAARAAREAAKEAARAATESAE